MKVLRPNFEKRGGLVVVIAQDVRTKEVLMQAYTNEVCFLETLRTGKAVYFSASRKERWLKGETSGDVQEVSDILIDCDGDTLIYVVEQRGHGACHTKARSCFYRSVVGGMLMDAPKEGIKENLAVIDVEVVSQIYGGYVI